MKKILSFIFFILTTQLIYSQQQINTSELYITGADFAVDGNYIEAERVFKQVIRLSPYYALGHYGLGKVYMYQGGNMRNAIRELKIAVDLDNRLAKAHFYLGVAYYLSEEYALAVTSYKKAFEIDERYVEALYNIGSIYDFMGHPSKSLIYYKKYLDEKLLEEEYFDY
jgi:tetratricopeptide (TPR) repeat protein